jgi:hypothetical protein
MNDLLPLMRDQRKSDADHLQLLAIFHFVFAGLAFVGLGFLCLHHAVVRHFLGHPEFWRNQQGGPPPEQILAWLNWFYLGFGVLFVTGGLLNVISGLCLRRRAGRLFSLVIAGLNCIQIPFGTALGVFTIIVLLRDSVREAYAAGATPPA